MMMVILLLNEFHMGEWKMAHFPPQFTLPLAVDICFGHFDDIAHFQFECRFIIGIWHTGLFNTGIGW